MKLVISQSVRKKLSSKHGGIADDEIKQCFMNIPDGYEIIRDVREKHQTDPPTWFFISETNQRRKLKVCFIVKRFETPEGEENRVVIKTVFPPDQADIENYEKHGKST